MTSKEIRNYIHNDLGIDKQSVQSIVREGIREEVAKYIEQELKDEDKWGDFIESEMKKTILDSVDDDRHSYLHCTVDKLYHEIDKTIHDEVMKRLRISLVPSKDIQKDTIIEPVNYDELKLLVKQVYDLTKRDFEFEEIMEYLMYHNSYSITDKLKGE